VLVVPGKCGSTALLFSVKLLPAHARTTPLDAQNSFSRASTNLGCHEKCELIAKVGHCSRRLSGELGKLARRTEKRINIQVFAMDLNGKFLNSKDVLSR
jgi:hypothetical protein